MKMEAELEGSRQQPRNPWGHQGLEGAGRTLPWIPRREHSPVTLFWTSGLQSYENINVVVSHQVFRCFVVTAPKCPYIKRVNSS